MKINFDQQFTTLDGSILKARVKDDSGEEKERTFTLKWACTESLLASYPREEIKGEEKMKRFRIAFKIEQGGEIDLESEEITKLKELIGINCSPLIVGQAWKMLEGK